MAPAAADNNDLGGKDQAREAQKSLQGQTELGKVLRGNKQLMDQYVVSAKKYNEITRDTFTYYKEAADALHKTIKYQGSLVELGGKRLRDTQQMEKLLSKSEETQKELSILYDKESQVFNDLLLKQTMMDTKLQGQYAQTLQKAMLEGKMTDKQLASLTELLKKRQHIYEKAEKQLEIDEAIAANILEIREETEKWKSSITKVFETAKAIGKDSKLMGAFVLTQGVEKLEKFHEGFEELHKSGLSAGQAIQGQFKGMNLYSMLGLSDTKGVLQGVVEQYGNINALSRDTVGELGHMAHEFGITGQEALGVNASLSQMPGETSETAAHAMELTGNLAKASGVAPGKIMKDMAKNSELMALGGYKSAKAFGEAALKAHKMGVELSTTKNVASGLLDFESSISKQMEASVLLGREINLDKARELALQGKSVEATEEVLKNIGGQAEFEKMNVLQKQALAAATGMTVEELQKAADAQQEQNKYSGEGAGLISKALGGLMEYGGAAVGFFKENGLLLMSSIQFLQQQNLGKIKQYAMDTAHWAKEKAHWVWKKAQSALGIGGGAAAGGGDMASKLSQIKALKSANPGMGSAEALAKLKGGDKTLDIAGGAADKTKKLSESAGKVKPQSGGGFKGFMKSLRDGLAEFGKKFGDVLKGALLLTLVGALMGTGLALIGLAVKAIGSSPQEMIMVGVALTLFAASLFIMSKSLGKISVSDVIKGGLALAILGAALIPAAFAFGMLKDIDTKKMIAFSIALPLLALAAAGLGFLFIPIALGAVALASLGVGLIAVAGGLLVLQSASAGLDVFGSLTALALSSAGLGVVALSMMGIAGGLGMMALSGIAAMPVIGMLIALATVAPALVALGGALGGMFGGGGGGKDEKMDVLIGKIDQLIAVASKGGTVNMDGKKVGEIVRLSINSSGVR